MQHSLKKRAWLKIRSLIPLRDYSTRVGHSQQFQNIDELISQCKFDPKRQYGEILDYLLTGYSAFATADKGRIHYIGFTSKSGAAIDGLEAFARFTFVLCGWLSGGRSRKVRDLSGAELDLIGIIDAGLKSSLVSTENTGWGSIGDNDSRFCQAATLVAAFVISEDKVWPHLSAEVRSAFLEWIRHAEDVIVPDNNWHLFHIVCDLFLFREGVTSKRRYMTIQEFYDKFHVCQGWFKDGRDLQYVDYYNIWIHFFLFISAKLPISDSDRELIAVSRSRFVNTYRYLFTSQGVPLFGRSICYRMATPLPLIIEARESNFSYGFAKRALDDITGFFVKNGGLRDGTVTQGYFARDLRLTDTYTGPGGCLWSLFALAMAWSIPEEHQFWSAAAPAYPVEDGDFDIELPEADLFFTGRFETGTVSIRRRLGYETSEFAAQSSKQAALEAILRRPIRPSNHNAKYPQIVTTWPPIFPLH